MATSIKIKERFQALTSVLYSHQNLWRPIPFYLPELPWQSDIPALATALRKLDELQLSELESDNAALVSWLGQYVPDIEAVAALQQVPLQPADGHCYSSRFYRDIPGRKWQQIQAFTGCMNRPRGRVLEWCAGKAHLSRTIYQRFQAPVTGLEWNSDLCDKGNKLSQAQAVDVHVQLCDVLSPAALGYIQQAEHAVALHACGDLHRRLIEIVSSQGMQSLLLSPCCYHLSADPIYRPFSRAGRNSGLQLSRNESRLAVQETVTAAAATAAKRRRKNAWRLGFDRLQRDIRKVDEYLPLPPVSDAALNGTFADFCHQAAAMKTLAIPQRVDWPGLERIGWQRQAEVSRMELPRHAFRRLLELWLVLDRALHLEESGYRVNVSLFCEREVTPRNLLISAFKTGRGNSDQAVTSAPL